MKYYYKDFTYTFVIGDNIKKERFMKHFIEDKWLLLYYFIDTLHSVEITKTEYNFLYKNPHLISK